jgi:transcriptional regulator with XRE-family HTH domain
VLKFQQLSQALGRVLRQARRSCGLTIRDLDGVSGGRFKASAVGSYERGERDISVRRLCELAVLLDADPAALLALAWSARTMDVPTPGELTVRAEDLEVSNLRKSLTRSQRR